MIYQILIKKNDVSWKLFSRFRIAILTLMLLAMFSATSTANAQFGITTYSGMTEGGAYYLIAVPPVWNGTLVIWNHGFTLEPPEELEFDMYADPEDDDLGPLKNLQLSQGFAVAASSFQQSGWALFHAKNDLQNLNEKFEYHVGEKPEAVIITGASLGGAVTAQALEEAHLGNIVGAFILCGAVAGSRNWDGALDLRLIYDVLVEGVLEDGNYIIPPEPDAAIPGGAKGLPERSTLTEIEIIFRVNYLTGILNPSIRTPDQQLNLDILLEMLQIPEYCLITDMLYATMNMSDLVYDTNKLNGKIGTENDNVSYDVPVTFDPYSQYIEDNIARVSPQPGAEKRLDRYFTPSGDVGDVKIVSMHTAQDGLVVVENQSVYASLVPEEKLTVAIVDADESEYKDDIEDLLCCPSHCDFTEPEVVAGWYSLLAWIDGSSLQPSADTIQGLCRVLAGCYDPTAECAQCRIDPAYQLQDMDFRIRPR